MCARAILALCSLRVRIGDLELDAEKDGSGFLVLAEVADRLACGCVRRCGREYECASGNGKRQSKVENKVDAG